METEKLAGASLLIFINKIDLLPEAARENCPAMIHMKKMLENTTNRHYRLQHCSAVTGVGLLEGMDWLVQDIASRVFVE